MWLLRPAPRTRGEGADPGAAAPGAAGSAAREAADVPVARPPAEPPAAVAPDRARLREALGALGLEDPAGRPLDPRSLERLVDLLLERRALAAGNEPPAIARDLAVAIDQEFERLAGAPPGEVIARLSAGQPGVVRRPGESAP